MRRALALALAACGPAHAVSAVPHVTARADAAVPVAVTARVEDAITFEGVPPLDTTIAAELAPYLAAPDVTLADFDGAMLVATQAGDTVQLGKLDAAGHAPAPVTHGDGPITDGRWVPGGGGAVLAIADHAGDEAYQLAVGDTLLTDGKSRNLAPVWTRDGRALAFASTARDGADADLWWSDGKTAASARLFYQASGTWTPVGFSADDKTLYAIARASSERAVLEAIDVKTGKVRALSGADDATTDARIGGKGTIYAISDRAVQGRTRRPRLWEVAGGAWRCLTPDLDGDVDAIDVAPSGKTIALTANVAGASQLWLWDVKKRALRRASGAPDSGVIAAIRFAGDRDVLALGWSTPASPGQVGTYDLAKKKLVAWTAGATPGLDPSVLVYPNHALAGAVPLAIYSPAPGRATGRAPVVIDLEDGPWRPRWQPEVQFLLARGFAVAEPDLRAGAIDDVGAVLDWIATQPDLDASHVSVLGGSLALAAAARYGDRLRACVDLWGMPDLAKLDPAKITVPLLVAAGANDVRVPDAMAIVGQTGGPVWSLDAADEGHGWQRIGNRTALWTAIAMFLSSASS